jgi:cullin-associated NEDD8-dissociated protein 1
MCVVFDMCVCVCVRDDEGYSDDEDMSWKVRRAAVKTLNALVATYADALPRLYEAAAEKLVQRFQVRPCYTHHL